VSSQKERERERERERDNNTHYTLVHVRDWNIGVKIITNIYLPFKTIMDSVIILLMFSICQMCGDETSGIKEFIGW
jgi:uncharacterized protein YceK